MSDIEYVDNAFYLSFLMNHSHENIIQVVSYPLTFADVGKSLIITVLGKITVPNVIYPFHISDLFSF